ncbi:MAG: MFS transporter [Candidatus Izemoplasmatales bacterium]|nr:MFS transporter [Candidatus Izemoplasmatales bacterium]
MHRFSENAKFKFFYFIRYFGDAFFYPFMSMYFLSKGVSERNLGIILAITPIVTILANPGWNYIVKDIKTSRTVLKFMTLLEGLLIITLTQVSGFELYALIVGLIAFFCSPFISIQDGYTSTFSNAQKIEYSSIRIYASIAYVIASAIAGFIIQQIGYTVPFLMAGAFFALTTLIAFWIKPIEKGLPPTQKKDRDVKALFHNANFFRYLVYYTIVIGAVRIGDSFFGVFLTGEIEMTISAYGLLYAAFVFVEVLTLRFLTLKGNMFPERVMMIFASILFVVRFLAYALNLPLWLLIAITMFRGVSWGTVIYTNIKYVIRIVKLENITTAILIMTLLFSMFTAIGNFFFGRLISQVGYNSLYFVITMVIVVGLLFFLAFPPRLKTEIEEEITTETL